MKSVSNDYKKVMDRQIRNRAYVSIGLGVVNQEAQKDAHVTTDCAEWGSKNAIFNNEENGKIYVTMEQNFWKADGSMHFMPEQYLQEQTACAITNEILGSLRIDFGQLYVIKGLTLDFGEGYPTEFTIETAEKTWMYTNDKPRFMTEDAIGETDSIIITPLSMVGGQQRLRVYNIVMGIGLTFSNEDVKSVSASSAASSISEELPEERVTLKLYDRKNRFHVDDSNSFISFLETMEKFTLSFGVELDDGKVEWLKYATLFLRTGKTHIKKLYSTFQEELAVNGFACGLYMGMYDYNNKINHEDFIKEKRWIARYYNGYKEMSFGVEPNEEYRPINDCCGWQFTSSGKVDGIKGRCDLDIFYGELAMPEVQPQYYTTPEFTLIDHFNKIGVDSSYKHRTKIAAANDIVGYSGSAEQNLYMLKLLNEGKLLMA